MRYKLQILIPTPQYLSKQLQIRVYLVELSLQVYCLNLQTVQCSFLL